MITSKSCFEWLGTNPGGKAADKGIQIGWGSELGNEGEKGWVAPWVHMGSSRTL